MLRSSVQRLALISFEQKTFLVGRHMCNLMQSTKGSHNISNAVCLQVFPDASDQQRRDRIHRSGNVRLETVSGTMLGVFSGR